MRPLLFLAVIASCALVSANARAGALAAYESFDESGAQNGYEWCYRSKLGSAKSCARAACDNAMGDDACTSAEYCDPSKWAGIVSLRRTDGSERFTLVCERDSRASIFVEVRKACKAFRREDSASFKQCNVTTILKPDGTATPNTTRYRWRNGELFAD
jgi:hypothetical protein